MLALDRAICGHFDSDAPLGGNALAGIEDIIHGGLLHADNCCQRAFAAEKVFGHFEGSNSGFAHGRTIDNSMEIAIDIPMERAIDGSITIKRMETLGQRVKIARGRLGWSQETLGREIGLTQPSVLSLEKSLAKASKHTTAIARKTGVRLQWLETGSGAMLEDGAAQPPHIEPLAPGGLLRPAVEMPGFTRDLPVHEGALCGEDGAFEFESQAADSVPRPPRLAMVKEAYALYIRGDSMSPWKEHGELVYVHPGLPVRPSDYVVIHLRPKREGEAHQAYVKRLLGENAREVKAQQFQPKKTLVFQRSKILLIHRIMKPEELLGA